MYRQIIGIPMGTNCAPVVADLFLFSYERVFMMSLSADKDAEIIEAFNSTSRYLDDLLNIDKGDASVVVYSNCQCSSAFVLSLTYCSIYLGQPCGHLLGTLRKLLRVESVISVNLYYITVL